MKNRTFKKQRRRFERLSRQWLEPLGLCWWSVRHVYFDDREQFRVGNDGETLMRCYSDWRYGYATIHVNTLYAACFDDAELERHYVHELCHIFLSEMREGDLDHEERVATTLAKAFLWLRDFAATERKGAP